MKVMKRFEFNNGDNCLFLIMNDSGWRVDVCERFGDAWSVFRGLFASDMSAYSKALNVFHSFEKFVSEGNRCEDFHVSDLNLN